MSKETTYAKVRRECYAAAFTALVMEHDMDLYDARYAEIQEEQYAKSAKRAKIIAAEAARRYIDED